MSQGDPARGQAPLTAGSTVGAYQILAPLGAGAMGDVYRARDTRLGRDVALKLLAADRGTNGPARDRIAREARIVASLNHPNVLAVHDVGIENGATYIVTELVDGESLRGLTPPLRKTLDLAAQIADGLSAAHAAGVTHRDLKPDNVMVTRDGRVKLLDFGVATTSGLPADDETTFEADGDVIAGTIGYMAPEQLRAIDVDTRADIFSFGALLYELLTGRRAFAGDTAADVMASILKADPPDLPAPVPHSVRAIVHRCLEKRREERFQSARDLAFALRQAAGQATGAAPDVQAASGVCTPAMIREQLTKLLSSAQLANAERLSVLLKFIVEEALAGRGAQLKEARIGLDVFGRRSDSYDPAIDPIVRVQMGRLRSKLRSYYNGQGAPDEVRIEIPVGGYVPSFERRLPQQPTSAEPSRTAPAPSDDLRIAVLPIVNMSPDPENQYFCDGLTEELISRLAQTAGLRVVARTSSFQFKDAARDIRKVGKQLDVSKVLEGSVRKAGNRIRVTVQLINVADGCHLWSDRYEGDLTDIFAIHEQISSSVQRSLQIQILGREREPAARAPQAIESYNHYLQGRFLWKKRTEQGLRAALEHFRRATELEPSFARAISGIADCHLMLGLSAAEAPQRCMPTAAEAAAKALALDDSLAEAHASLAAVKSCYGWDHAGAQQGYQRSIALDPSYATAFHWLGLLGQAAFGRFAVAIDSLEQAIELDPLSPPIIADASLVSAFREDLDASAMYSRRTLELDPNFHRPYWFLGLSQGWNGDFPEAEASLKQGLERCPGAAFRTRLLGALGFVYGRWGKKDAAADVKRELLRMRETSYVPSFELAQVEIGVGNTAGALACLEDSVINRESFAVFIKVWRSFRSLAPEPRYRALLAQIGLES